jgi:hypothetical protein
MALRRQAWRYVARGRSVDVSIARSTGGGHLGGPPAALCGGHPKILPRRFAGRISGTHPSQAAPRRGLGYASPDRRRHPSSAPSLARRLPGEQSP